MLLAQNRKFPGGAGGGCPSLRYTPPASAMIPPPPLLACPNHCVSSAAMVGSFLLQWLNPVAMVGGGREGRQDTDDYGEAGRTRAASAIVGDGGRNREIG